MLIAHYGHRLPADYDLSIIRNRAAQRGALWDAIPELYFKAFMLRERGQYGAISSEYSSLYLWQRDQSFCDALVGGRYKVVTDSFGRAEIETRVALDARKGSGRVARFVYKQEQDIALDADLTSVFAVEIERNAVIARQKGTVVAAVGIDAQNWRITRILLSEEEPGEGKAGVAYQVLYLAKPLLDTLPE
jgi:Domain of unknown function (DUF4865)